MFLYGNCLRNTLCFETNQTLLCHPPLLRNYSSNIGRLCVRMGVRGRIIQIQVANQPCTNRRTTTTRPVGQSCSLFLLGTFILEQLLQPIRENEETIGNFELSDIKKHWQTMP